jgi:hypothetical protein
VEQKARYVPKVLTLLRVLSGQLGAKSTMCFLIWICLLMDGLKSHLSRLFDVNKEDQLIPHKDLKFHNEVHNVAWVQDRVCLQGKMCQEVYYMEHRSHFHRHTPFSQIYPTKLVIIMMTKPWCCLSRASSVDCIRLQKESIWPSGTSILNCPRIPESILIY